MIKIYFKSAWRSLWKNRTFSLINLAGLSLGLACIMTLLALVNKYVTTDEFHIHKDRMYYLKTFSPDGGSYRLTVFPLLYEIQRSCPEVEAITHWQQWNSPWLKYGTNYAIGNPPTYVDPDFLTLFSFGLQEGNSSLALKDKFSVVISQAIRTQLFGNKPALGQTITIDDTVHLTVTGVLSEPPANSSLKPDVLFPVALLKAAPGFSQMAGWYNTFAENYLMLRKGADPKAVDAKIAGLIKQFYAPEQKKAVVKLVPFRDLKKESGPIVKAIIAGATASAIFLWLIIVVNLLNLNTATLFGRNKEFAIRRMIGSGKAGILIQFCVENALIVMGSLVIGFFVFNGLLLPRVNEVIGSRFGSVVFQWRQDYLLAALFVFMALAIVILAATIPAWSLIKLKVTDAVKGRISAAGNNNRIRNIFITVQFTLAVLFICITIILNSQIRHMKDASLGYNKNELAIVNLDMAFKDPASAASRFDALLQSLKGDPHVKSFSTSMVIPTAYQHSSNDYIDLDGRQEAGLQQESFDAGFAGTYEVPIVQGRNFNDELAASEKGKVILNESAVKVFGWTNPIGHRIQGKGGDETVTVVGVIRDFHYSDMGDPIGPVIYYYSGKPALANMNYFSIRLEGNHGKEVLSRIEQAFKEMPSRRFFSYHYMSDLVDDQYSLLDGILKVTNFTGVLAILISCMGMLGLITLFARRRVKEIGVRKVLGASVADIARLLTRDFLVLVLVAIVVATPFAWWLMSQWLQGFSYRVDIGWWMFLLAGAIAFGLALLTVGYQAIRAANANPVDSLRNE